MTKELRKKFILINMALVGTVLLIVFAVLCFQNYQRLEQDSMRVMERYFNDNGARRFPSWNLTKSGSGEISHSCCPSARWWTAMGSWSPTRAITSRSARRR